LKHLNRSSWANMILILREEYGLHWVWNNHEIYQCKKTGNYKLSPVVIAKFFDLETNVCLKEKLWELGGFRELDNYLWDTKGNVNAWYPEFKDRPTAIKCIEDVDKHFDNRFLDKLRAIEY
jgi:hypothetical protein